MSSLEIPPSLLPTLSAIFAIIFLTMGIVALVLPRLTLTSIFHFPAPPRAQDALLTDNLIRIYGIRDVYMGVAGLAAWWSGDRFLLGVLMGLTAGVGAVDGVVQGWQTGGMRWNHWGHGIVEGIVAVGLVQGW